MPNSLYPSPLLRAFLQGASFATLTELIGRDAEDAIREELNWLDFATPSDDFLETELAKEAEIVRKDEVA